MGEGFEKTIMAWEVQKYGYEKGSPLGPGLVSRGRMFEDSPDAEFISEGDHTKNPGQVALGRHGNFFHWGYSGTPKHMTEQGKKVFLNSIHYIAKFKGQKPLSPKVSPGIWSLGGLDKQKATKDYKLAWAEYNEFIDKANAKFKGRHEKAKAKKERGEKLDEQERMFIDPPKYFDKPSFEDYMKRQERDLFPLFGTDGSKYNAYYKENLPYFRADPKRLGSFAKIVDEEAKRLKKSVWDKDFLPFCIKALKDDNKKEDALTLLKRYTFETFETYKEWNKWYKKNKKRLFFTANGGYKYYINTNK